ncbi:type II toxin-antitoxin system RelE/ParE family toxin [Hoeflea ulvae]|uniref:Toxin n=1 Tax=Hoeflea ulvae TaxID=2983764 RepID=A0ABT3YDI9_9HYPH|nr:type II toxin-antitoxin system RelE/ParE family toxin [Hoeflea ulvae]MCY0093949.1 type II toxin-antitoxin system RelE/ParE family toxin [Hoeflea ulvae]
MGFRLTVQAEDDIIGIAEAGLRLFGETQALSYHLQLFEMFELIAANPLMARERHEITPPVRVHPFKAHLIIYMQTQNDEILILRIRHSHEDWMDE